MTDKLNVRPMLSGTCPEFEKGPGTPKISSENLCKIVKFVVKKVVFRRFGQIILGQIFLDRALARSAPPWARAWPVACRCAQKNQPLQKNYVANKRHRTGRASVIRPNTN